MSDNPPFSSSSSSAEKPKVSPNLDATAAWIDENIKSETDLEKTIEFLVAQTLPPDPAAPSVPIVPFSYSLDEQLWPWNRASERFANKVDAPHAAAEVNATMYLAIIALQIKYGLRLHKGMPLCNVGYFLGGLNKQLGLKAWLLGTAEDAFTDFATVREALSFKNLLGSKIPRPALEQYLSTIESRYIELSTMPFLPELVPDFWLNPFLVVPSAAAMDSVRRLEDTVIKSYPRLPRNNLALLEEIWAFIRLPEGIGK